MKILSWNCQGLGNPLTVSSLCSLCWREQLDIVFVMETMIDKQRLNHICTKCGFSNEVFDSNGNQEVWVCGGET